MGVDITAYKLISSTRSCAEDDDKTFMVDEDVLKRLPLAMKGLQPGTYKADDERLEVRFGPAVFFIMWCDQLAQLAGYTQQEALKGGLVDKPFLELTGFSERHGLIGPAASAKLHHDFVSFDALAAGCGGEFYDFYRKLAEAFAHAKDGGGVEIS